MHGQAFLARPQFDGRVAGFDLHGLARPRPHHAVPRAVPPHVPVPADLALVAQERPQPRRLRQRPQPGPLQRQPVDGPLAGGAVHPHVGHRVHPRLRLPVQVGVVDEARRRPEVPLDVPHAALHLPLGLRPVRVAQRGREAHPQREVQEPRVPHRLARLVAVQHDDLRVVVQAPLRDAAQGPKSVDVAAQEGRRIRPAHELHVQGA
jgi:hypothetical protein